MNRYLLRVNNKHKSQLIWDLLQRSKGKLRFKYGRILAAKPLDRVEVNELKL
jgi:hypothetical protein